MKQFIYDTHVHTSEVSHCARATAEESVRFYKSIGFTGIIITDHFICGGKTIASQEEWINAVDFLCSGYQKALEIGQQIGLQVFFGWEYTRVPLYGTDFLTYGLSADWLKEHPEIFSMELGEYLDFIRSSGGMVSHAHPFREAGYIDMIRLLPRKVDATEAFSACRTDFENAQAMEYADKYSLYKTFGTDNHLGSKQKKLAGMVFERELTDVLDFITVVKSGKSTLFSN